MTSAGQLAEFALQVVELPSAARAMANKGRARSDGSVGCRLCHAQRLSSLAGETLLTSGAPQNV
jgi:hypothetical protein